MKINLLLLFCLAAFSSPTLALDFQKTAPLYEHLCEVNAEWKKIAPDASLLVPVNFPSDRERIQKHLELVEKELRAREMSSLSTSQQANRLRHLDVLHGYWQTGLFPTNHYHTKRQPYFRDNFNVLCAVGFLMWEDGQHDIVNKINFENNYAFIAELAVKYPELETWAKENGFTLNELAWIQPNYEPSLPKMENWGNGGGLNPGGRINVMAKDDDETRLFVAGQFSSIDGLNANNIAVWDGTTWSTLGDGVVGEIFDLEYYKGWNSEKLFVAGNFHLPGQPLKQNIAEYDFISGSWKGLQTGDMQGTVYALYCNGNLFIGGDFQKIDGEVSRSLAIYSDYYQEWNHWEADKSFQVDGTVYEIEPVGNYLLIGGTFQHVYHNEWNTWSDAPHLVYYAWHGEWLTLAHSLPPVRSLAYFHGNIFVGHQFEDAPTEETGISILKGGLWFEKYCYPLGDNMIHGFTELDDANLIAYGGFAYDAFIIGAGAVTFHEEDVYPSGYLMADNTVRAMLRFQEEIYVAGDFTTMFNQNYPGMVRVKLEYVPTDNPKQNLQVNVVPTPNHLIINYEDLEQEANLMVYDLQGRPIATQTLQPGDGQWTLDAQSDWASGLYVWHLENADGKKVGKWIVTK
ncbi:MAG: hypothetical protein OHK0019_20170 [Saprospiraceae bacterium]